MSREAAAGSCRVLDKCVPSPGERGARQPRQYACPHAEAPLLQSRATRGCRPGDVGSDSKRQSAAESGRGSRRRRNSNTRKCEEASRRRPGRENTSPNSPWLHRPCSRHYAFAFRHLCPCAPTGAAQTRDVAKRSTCWLVCPRTAGHTGKCSQTRITSRSAGSSQTARRPGRDTTVAIGSPTRRPPGVRLTLRHGRVYGTTAKRRALCCDATLVSPLTCTAHPPVRGSN